MKRYAPIFAASFFIATNLGAVLYLNSSLLGRFFEPGVVSLFFILGALGNIILFLLAPRLIESLGKKILLAGLLVVAVFTTLGLSFSESPVPAALSFLVYSSILFIIFYLIDIFIQESVNEGRTGEVRGLHLTFINLGIALGPLVVALFAHDDSLSPVYLAAAFLLLPPLLLILLFKSRIPIWHGLHHRHASLPLAAWWRKKNVRRVTIARFVLEFFFTIMVIYVPVYLHSVLGFSWQELGLAFTVMLIPFIVLEWPVGEIADRFLGEKELMVTGFLIMGGSVLIMPFLGAVLAAWMAVLFLSRVGASIIEITTESYFFKHASGADTRLISIFRLARPASIISGGIIGTVALSLFSFDKIFFILAIAIFLGLKASLLIRDTL